MTIIHSLMNAISHSGYALYQAKLQAGREDLNAKRERAVSDRARPVATPTVIVTPSGKVVPWSADQHLNVDKNTSKQNPLLRRHLSERTATQVQVPSDLGNFQKLKLWLGSLPAFSHTTLEEFNEKRQALQDNIGKPVAQREDVTRHIAVPIGDSNDTANSLLLNLREFKDEAPLNVNKFAAGNHVIQEHSAAPKLGSIKEVDEPVEVADTEFEDVWRAEIIAETERLSQAEQDTYIEAENQYMEGSLSPAESNHYLAMADLPDQGGDDHYLAMADLPDQGGDDHYLAMADLPDNQNSGARIYDSIEHLAEDVAYDTIVDDNSHIDSRPKMALPTADNREAVVADDAESIYSEVRFKGSDPVIAGGGEYSRLGSDTDEPYSRLEHANSKQAGDYSRLAHRGGGAVSPPSIPRHGDYGSLQDVNSGRGEGVEFEGYADTESVLQQLRGGVTYHVESSRDDDTLQQLKGNGFTFNVETDGDDEVKSKLDSVKNFLGDSASEVDDFLSDHGSDVESTSSFGEYTLAGPTEDDDVDGYATINHAEGDIGGADDIDDDSSSIASDDSGDTLSIASSSDDNVSLDSNDFAMAAPRGSVSKRKPLDAAPISKSLLGRLHEIELTSKVAPAIRTLAECVGKDITGNTVYHHTEREKRAHDGRETAGIRSYPYILKQNGNHVLEYMMGPVYVDKAEVADLDLTGNTVYKEPDGRSFILSRDKGYPESVKLVLKTYLLPNSNKMDPERPLDFTGGIGSDGKQFDPVEHAKKSGKASRSATPTLEHVNHRVERKPVPVKNALSSQFKGEVIFHDEDGAFVYYRENKDSPVKKVYLLGSSLPSSEDLNKDLAGYGGWVDVYIPETARGTGPNSLSPTMREEALLPSSATSSPTELGLGQWDDEGEVLDEPQAASNFIKAFKEAAKSAANGSGSPWTPEVVKHRDVLLKLGEARAINTMERLGLGSEEEFLESAADVYFEKKCQLINAQSANVPDDTYLKIMADTYRAEGFYMGVQKATMAILPPALASIYLSDASGELLPTHMNDPKVIDYVHANNEALADVRKIGEMIADGAKKSSLELFSAFDLPRLDATHDGFIGLLKRQEEALKLLKDVSTSLSVKGLEITDPEWQAVRHDYALLKAASYLTAGRVAALDELISAKNYSA